MTVEISFTFTDRALAASEDHPGFKFSSTLDLDLQAGDLLSFEELMPHVFVIVRRHHHLVDPDHLQTTIHLDLFVPSTS